MAPVPVRTQFSTAQLFLLGEGENNAGGLVGKVEKDSQGGTGKGD